MNAKHRKTLEAVFSNPLLAGILWADIEGLFVGLGGRVEEGRGSRVTIRLNGLRVVFHRPHPHKTTVIGALKAVRRFLIEAGVKP